MQSFSAFVLSTKRASNRKVPILIKSLKSFIIAIMPYLSDFIIANK